VFITVVNSHCKMCWHVTLHLCNVLHLFYVVICVFYGFVYLAQFMAAIFFVATGKDMSGA